MKNMIFKLVLLFTVIPFIELALLIKIGTIIGTFDTILLIIITGLLGAVMVRAAGIQCLFRIQENLRSGTIPTEELFNGVLILIAGALLITPGLITDGTGFILLIRPTREFVKKYIKKWIKSKIKQGKFNSNIQIHL